MKKLLFILILIPVLLTAQKKDPDEILNLVQEKFGKVENYIVDISIDIDVNFLKVPESKAVLYYEKPDKVHMESESFALLPKQGLNFSPTRVLQREHSAIYVNEEEFNGYNCDVIKIIPISSESQIVLSTMWIDVIDHVVRKIETTTKEDGTISIELDYNNANEYGLPERAVFSFKIDELNIPNVVSGEFDQKEEPKRGSKGPLKGTVIVTYTNYKINTELPENIFEEVKN